MSRRTRWALAIVMVGGVSALGYRLYYEHWPHKKVLRSVGTVVDYVSDASLLDIRVCRCEPQRHVEFTTPQGVRVAASLYGAEQGQARPTILLLHGNTPLGRSLPLYRVLASRLADEGFVVLAFDFAGFGESGDPFVLGPEKALNQQLYVDSAIDYLREKAYADMTSLFIVAHSMGASSGMRAGIRSPDVKAIVAIGPARRVKEMSADADFVSYMWERFHRTYHQATGLTIPGWVTKEYWFHNRLEKDMEHLLPYFAQEGHKPLLLIDGETESDEDLRYLRDYYDQMAEPKRYVTVAGSDHYANTEALGALFASRGCRRSGCRDPLAELGILAFATVYDDSAVSDHVDAIVDWTVNRQ